MLALFVLVLLIFPLLLLGLGGWLVSFGLRVPDRRPQRMRRVLAVTAETITLPRQEVTTSVGLCSIVWQQGDAMLGEIVASSAQTVTRRIIKASTPPTAGSLVYWHNKVYYENPQSALGLTYEEVRVPGRLGELPAWLLPGERKTWVLLVHGFRATREEALRVLPAIVELGFPALVITYRNDAGAPRSPDHRYHLGETEWEDVEAAVRYALTHGAHDIVLFGWSMGGCLVETFLRRSSEARQVRAVVLDSPVLNWHSVLDAQAHSLHLPRWSTFILKWMAERLAGIDLATFNYDCPNEEMSIPTLLFHGTADTQVPVGPSDRLAQACPDLVTYVRVEGVGHTRAWNADPQAYEQALKTFLQEVAVR
ncbi:MAG TPA: alpha/beta fold hydrolase [Ktedonobacteraceae bacterium]